MMWHIVCLNPELKVSVNEFPFHVGRVAGPTSNCAIIEDPVISQRQFLLERRLSGIWYVNQSETNPASIDGQIVNQQKLTPDSAHVLQIGDIVIAIGTNDTAVYEAAVAHSQELFYVTHDEREIGPLTSEQLVEGCEKGYFQPTTTVRSTYQPGSQFQMSDFIDFTQDAQRPPEPASPHERVVTSEEILPELGESFKCPYCRTVSNLADVLSVSVSPGLLGDPVLGDGEQSRFLPTQFNGNGLALDREGGVCTEIACPRCHMSLPRALLETPQSVMSVIGAAGAGKSVFLASCVWNCRQQLLRRFKLFFTDLAPAWNAWIRAYEERLFFQQDNHALQQIEKTDLQGSNVSRSILLDGDNVLVPMPCFFKVAQKKSTEELRSFVLYDCAGEHFRPGADVHSSLVTLNMLGADVLFFLFDPSADPRFHPFLDLGTGTAGNYAQMQDVLLSEVAAKIAKYYGNNAERKLHRPLLFGISKCDLLRKHLPLDAEPYKETEGGGFALDVAALHKISDSTERFLEDIAPEVTATAHDISEDVWFLPVSALGHNPMREGVRPCDINPIWVELPVVFTLAKQGLVPTVNGNI